MNIVSVWVLNVLTVTRAIEYNVSYQIVPGLIKNVEAGVPQVSVLGALLYYIVMILLTT